MIPDLVISKLKSHDYGLIKEDGTFRASYMHYFFLGRFLSQNREEHKEIIERISKRSYLSSNHLTLLFIIHHTDDSQIIDDILRTTMSALNFISPAILDRDETKRFGDLVSALPENILSSDSVETERQRERNARDVGNYEFGDENDEQASGKEIVNDCYRIFKNNEILAQVIRNKCGSLEKSRIEEIITAVADGGLRLVNSVLKDEDEIIAISRYFHQKYPDYDFQKIKRFVQFYSFAWAMYNVKRIVNAINYPEIREVVAEVVRKKSTPAYDLIGYFSYLDSSMELTEDIKRNLESLRKKYDYPFFKGVLSLRTQQYMNTHHTRVKIEQSVCSLLGIDYRPKRRVKW